MRMQESGGPGVKPSVLFSPACPACSKPKKKHYPFCFPCFARLPMGIRYILSSASGQARQYGYEAGLVHLAEEAKKVKDRSGGDLF